MLVIMSDKELRRINVIQSVVEKRMRRRDAAHQLALTERQTQRLMNRFRESGAAGLLNLRRGRPGNHRLPESLKLRVLSLLHDHYSDFGPTNGPKRSRIVLQSACESSKFFVTTDWNIVQTHLGNGFCRLTSHVTQFSWKGFIPVCFAFT